MRITATERARRSDSLYYDTTTTNRRVLCDMIANLESNLEESKDENAKLRKLVRDMCKAIVFPYAVVNPAVLTKRARELGVKMEDGTE